METQTLQDTQTEFAAARELMKEKARELLGLHPGVELTVVTLEETPDTFRRLVEIRGDDTSPTSPKWGWTMLVEYNDERLDGEFYLAHTPAGPNTLATFQEAMGPASYLHMTPATLATILGDA